MNELKYYSFVSVERIILLLFGVWLAALSAFFYWLFSHYNRLTKDKKQGSLKQILDKILKDQAENRGQLIEIDKQLKNLFALGERHAQKIGIIRFNPFDETGGDQSFSLALLDGKDTGFVITGLHTRQRTRVYVKSVKGGKAKYKLSSEETKAINEAKKQ